MLSPQLNERQRRRFAATEARTFGHGGIAAAARACGLAENTVRKGLAELDGPAPLATDRVRSEGAGRKRAVEADPQAARRSARVGGGRGPRRSRACAAVDLQELAQARRRADSGTTGSSVRGGGGGRRACSRPAAPGRRHPERPARRRGTRRGRPCRFAAPVCAVRDDASDPLVVASAITGSRPEPRAEARASSTGSHLDELTTLSELRDSGTLSIEEFETEKARIMEGARLDRGRTAFEA